MGYRAPTIEHPVSSIEHPVSSIECPASRIAHPTSPVREAAVFAVEQRRVAGLKRVRGGGCFIKGDAEAGFRGWQQVAALELNLLGEDVRQDAAGPARQLQDAEVRDSEGKVQAGGGGDRAQRVVRRQ